MAGQSSKKEKKQLNEMEKYLKSSIFIISAIFLACFAYSMLFKGYELRRVDIIGFVVLSLINFILYHLIITLRNAFYINYIYDLLIVNLLVMLLVNLHWKFWFLYLIIPGYGFVKLAIYTFNYTKTIGQADPDEILQANQAPNSKKKVKIEKIRH